MKLYKVTDTDTFSECYYMSIYQIKANICRDIPLSKLYRHDFKAGKYQDKNFIIELLNIKKNEKRKS